MYIQDKLAAYTSTVKTLVDRMAPESLTRWKHTVDSLSKTTVTKFIRISPAVQLELAPGQFSRWCQLALEIDAVAPALAASFVSQSDRLLTVLLPRHLEDWGRKGFAIYNGKRATERSALHFYERSSELISSGDFRALSLTADSTRLIVGSHPVLAQRLIDETILLCKLLKVPPHALLAVFVEMASDDPLLPLRLTSKLCVLKPSRLTLPLTDLLAACHRHAPKALRLALKATHGMREPAIAKLFTICTQLASQNVVAALALLKSGPKLLKVADFNQIEAWRAKGAQLARQQNADQTSWNALATVQSRTTLKHITATVNLYKVRPLLGAYTHALSGSETQIVVSEEHDWLQPQSNSESKTIKLPLVSEGGGDWRANFRYYKIAATHQAGHIEYDAFSWEPSRSCRLLRDLRPALAKRTGTVPTTLNAICQSADLASSIFAIFENLRIDRAVMYYYRGMRKDYMVERAKLLSKHTESRLLGRRAALLKAILRSSLGENTVLVPRRDEDTARRLIRLTQLRHTDAGSALVAEQTLRTYALLLNIPDSSTTSWSELTTELPRYIETKREWSTYFMCLIRQLPQSGPQAEQNISEQTDATDQGNELEGSQPPNDESYRAGFDSQIVPTAQYLDGDGSHADFRRLKSKPARTSKQGDERPYKTDQISDGDELQADKNTTLYSEWDNILGYYRPNWCAVRELTVPNGDQSYFGSVLAEYKGLEKTIKRQFELLSPQTYRRRKRFLDGDEIDTDVALTAMMDIRAGINPEQRIYTLNTKHDRSVAVAFLLDISASTAETVDGTPTPAPQTRTPHDEGGGRPLRPEIKVQKRIIDIEKESIVLLVRALEMLGDLYGIYAFSGYGREKVEFYVIKELHDRLSADTVGGRLSNLNPTHATRMGAAIRHAASKLALANAQSKHLFLISDGRPQDRGYNREGTGKDYALGDTRRALDETQQMDITPFCLTVDRRGADYLATMSAGMAYVVVPDVFQLPARLAHCYRMATN